MASLLLQKIEVANSEGTKTGVVYTNIPSPSTYRWGKSDISDPKAGRTTAGNMKKMLRGRARTLDLSWRGKSYAAIATTLAMFDYEYLWLTYIDALTGAAKTSLMYMGDMSADSFKATNGGVWEVASVRCIQAIPDPA